MMLKYTSIIYANKSTTAIKPQSLRIQDPLTTKLQCKIIQNTIYISNIDPLNIIDNTR